MDARLVLKQMLAVSGKSQRLISVEIGRHPTYVTSLVHGGSYPQIDTFASIARACGCEVIIRFPNEEISIDGWQIDAREDVSLDGQARRQRENS